MEPEDFIYEDPFQYLTETDDFEEIEYDDSTFGEMLNSSNDF